MLEKLEQGHKALRRLCRNLITTLFCYSFLNELGKLRNKQHNLADSLEIVCNTSRELKVVQVGRYKRPCRGGRYL